MIVSHTHRFIFLKTNKTAGTSVEIALSKHCGAADIITPISPEDEETRRALGHRGPQHYLCPIGDYGLGDVARAVLKGKRKMRFYNHIPAREIRDRVGNEVWDSYYKFCFERNPWDRVVSLYYWRFRSDPRPTISDFVASAAPLALKRGGREVYTIDGQVVVDRVCRFESLTDELELVRAHVGIPERLELPRAKSRYRKDKRPYREILAEEDKARIGALFRDEIDLLGYEF